MTTSKNLLDAHDLAGLALPNRVVMAPMTRVRAAAGGLATPSMATYYAQRASAGLIVSEGVQPSLQGQSNPGTPGLHTDAQVASWLTVTDAVHAAGGRIFAQVMHGGRVSHPDTTGLQPVGPSALAATGEVFTPTGPAPAPVPRALATTEVPAEAASYADAAARAVGAGFDGVELHGANGYLITQFLATGSNLRTDRYGGSVANRIRFAVEAAAGVVDAIGAARTGIRLSPGSGIWGAQETGVRETYLALLAELAALDLAYVHLEATTDQDVLVDLRRAWPATLIVNPVHPMSSQQADRTAADHWLGLGADLVSFGRAYISNPDLVERLRHGRPVAPRSTTPRCTAATTAATSTTRPGPNRRTAAPTSPPAFAWPDWTRGTVSGYDPGASASTARTAGSRFIPVRCLVSRTASTLRSSVRSARTSPASGSGRITVTSGSTGTRSPRSCHRMPPTVRRHAPWAGPHLPGRSPRTTRNCSCTSRATAPRAASAAGCLAARTLETLSTARAIC